MAGSESILEALFEEETLDDLEEDVDMIDAENLRSETEGEIPSTALAPPPAGNEKTTKVESHGNKNSRNRVKKKKKNKKQKSAAGSVADINRFVIDTCRHLKERKQYLVWNAVGCLGVPALRELVKEVDAIQACGGQLTADGHRLRTGGGILWNILKTREPDVYKEIMAKGKELEKQLCHGNTRQAPKGNIEAISSKVSQLSNGSENQASNSPPPILDIQPKWEEKAVEGRISIKNRIRVPVAYDDL